MIDKDISEIIDKDFFKKISHYWKIGSIKLIGKVQNIIYEFENENGVFILRITDSIHRSKELIEAELEWIEFLNQKNIEIAKPLYSMNMNHVETIYHNDYYFFITVFEKAKGKIADINNPLEWNKTLFENWGQLAGKIHKLSKDFNPVNKRCYWFELELNKNFQDYLPDTDKFIINEFNSLKNLILHLPKSKDNFGLTHSDLHFKNFFTDKDKITLFDFDDCCYNWFIFDFVTALHHAVLSYDDSKLREEFTNDFIYYFFSGYKREINIDKDWLRYLPEFLRFRDLQMYILIHKKYIKLSKQIFRPAKASYCSKKSSC